MALTNQLTFSQQSAFDKFLAENKQNSFDFVLIGNGVPMPIVDKENQKHPTPMYSSKAKQGETVFASPEGDTVRWVYSKSRKLVTVNGQQVYEETPETIWFEASQMGKIGVARTNHALLIRLLFSDQCANGINPAKTEPITGYEYQLIQPAKTASQVAANRSTILKVQLMVDENTPEENRFIAQRINGQGQHVIRVDEGDDAIRVDLFDLAAVNPDVVLAATSDQTLKATALVEQAVSNGLLRFQHETREWKYATGQVLLSVPSGDYTEVLTRWLLDVQGQSAMRSLKESLKDAGKSKPKKVSSEPVPEGMKRGKFGRLEPIEQPEEAEA